MTLKKEWIHPNGWLNNQSSFSLSKGTAAVLLCAGVGKLVLLSKHRLAVSYSLLRRCHQLNSDADIMRNFSSKNCVALSVSLNRQYYGENLCSQ